VGVVGVVGVAAALEMGCTRADRSDPTSEVLVAAAQDASAPALPRITPADAAELADAAALSDGAALADAEARDGEVESAYTSATPRSARSIGHTSLVFKVELTNGKKAAFKPASRRGPLRYKGEIAARRLALALGLPNVPPALFRALPAAPLAAAKDAGEMIVADGVVKGALIPWIDGLSLLAVESAPLAGEWKRWLRSGERVPDEQRELARQLSTLVAFDFVTGNWDRFSGGNLGIDKATGTLLYIDNDGAFFDVPPADGLERNKRLVQGVDRLSRSFVARLRALDDAALAHALGEETPGVPLLSPRALAGVVQRRKELLAIVDAKLESAGEAATLAFP
jgi:hypothetical protein